MGISSLGVGSSILTQDVLDQLRKADEGQRIRPITFDLANENDKKSALKVLDANMTNFRDAINEMKTATLYDERKTTVSGTAVEVTASANSDVQDFTLDVTKLAAKQIDESGTFDSDTAKIANGDGAIEIAVGPEKFQIAYNADTTLKDLKKSINENTDGKLEATIVQTKTGEYKLFISSTETGKGKDISITDNADADGDGDGDGANLKTTALTDDLSQIQPGADAEFKFNGQPLTRASNEFDDLISGYNIKFKEVGFSEVKVEQDRDEIMKRMDSFVNKYNEIITELEKQTKSSTDSSERGIFSGNSTIKNMRGVIRDMISSVSGGVGTMQDYGFEIDREGKMSLDKSVVNKKLDDDPKNVEAFFSGGDFTTTSGTVQLNGAFSSFYDAVNTFTKANGNLDLVKDNINESISSLEDRKESATERLDAKYAIMKKQYAAYDLMISKMNSASNMFSQMVNAQNTANR